MKDRVVTVAENDHRPYGQTAAARGHRLAADEPEALGGLDSGPDPFELVLAGLGACTTMTMRMYAARKGWPVRHLSAEIRLERGAPGGEPRDRFRRLVTIEGDLDADQRARLVAIADLCPVGRMLEAGADVVTEEALASAAGPA